MAEAVAQAIEGGSALAVEAGTGVGKTYAYLVPALLSGRRVLVSTATKALQDQLFSRDLPAVSRALARPVRAALLKGRSSYLCQHRLELAWQLAGARDRYLGAWLSRIERWAQGTDSGDLAEVSGLDERSEVIPLVSSTRDNCLGGDCPKFKTCHLNAARKAALGADLVVVNHHLYFADLTVRESGMAELLPSMEVLIFDEAHQLNEIGVQFLGQVFSSAQLLDWGRDMVGAGLELARGLSDWTQLSGAVEQASRVLRLSMEAGARREGGARRWRWTQETPEGCQPKDWSEAVVSLTQALQHAVQALLAVAQSSPDLARLSERGQELLQRLQALHAPLADDHARWLEVGQGYRLVLVPLDAAQAFGERVLRDAGTSPRSWVFASATLGTDEALSWFTRPLGLQAVRTLRVPSPFDYGRQAALHVPAGLPRPNDPAHAPAVAQMVQRWGGALGGRTLVLTTTLRALRTVADALSRWSEAEGGPTILVQGRQSKRELLERFRLGAGAAEGATGCILVASASFWEGVDVPGEALQLVVIDKLPFPPPDDPLVEARSRQLDAQGVGAFAGYFLPSAAMSLKQGAGRLIRREADRGVLVVCDVRLRQMGYGKTLLASLPPMRWLADEAAMDQALERLLTTASTTDRP